MTYSLYVFDTVITMYGDDKFCYNAVFNVISNIISIASKLVLVSVCRSTVAPYICITPPHVQQNTKLYCCREM